MAAFEMALIPCGQCGITYGTEAKAGPSVCPDCGGTTELFEVLCCNDESDCWCRLGECNCDCPSCRDCTLCKTAELT